MLKKTIKFDDLDGNSVTEDFYFHLSKADIAEMELSQKGGLTAYLNRIVAEEDGPKLVEIFKGLLTKTVGKRSDDGRRFIRNQEIVDDFVQTEAYSELFVELATNAGSAAAFVNGIVPNSMHEAVAAAQAQTAELPAVSDVVPTPVPSLTEEPAWLTEGRIPTPEEIRNATPEQMQIAFTRKANAPAPEITPPNLA